MGYQLRSGIIREYRWGLLTLKGKPFEYNQRDTVLNGGFIAFRDQQSKKIAFEALAQSGVLD